MSNTYLEVRLNSWWGKKGKIPPGYRLGQPMVLLYLALAPSMHIPLSKTKAL